jgi:hypothetical protein
LLDAETLNQAGLQKHELATVIHLQIVIIAVFVQSFLL